MRLWWSEDRRIRKLRSELSKLEGLSWQQQIAGVEQIRRKYGHSIRRVDLGFREIDLRRFTCFAFALELHRWDKFLPLKAEYGFTVNPSFVESLLSGVADKSVGDVGDLAIYSTAESSMTHAGIVCPDGVCSKWGTGEVWLHGTFEIPTEFGSVVRYYERPPLSVTVERLGENVVQQIWALKNEGGTE